MKRLQAAVLAEKQEPCLNCKIYLKAVLLPGQLKSFSLRASLEMPFEFMNWVCVCVSLGTQISIRFTVI